MKTPSRRHSTAFTLIELLAVITIILLLAGLVVGGLGFANDKQARSKAAVQIALLEKAIEDYKSDTGSYPGTANTAIAGNVSEQLYIALFYNGLTNGRIYLPDLDPRTTKQGWVTASTGTTVPASLKITDPWGNNYRYRIGTNAQNPDFDLWSYGKDGRHATGGSATAFDPKAKDNLDDIRNF
jgi:general secretion pathway protein G